MKKFMILIFSMLLLFYPAFTDVSPPINGDNDFNIEQSLFNSDVAVAEINAIDNDVGISVTTNTYQNSVLNDYLQLQDINSLQISYWESVDLTHNELDITNAERETDKTEGLFRHNIGKWFTSNLIWSYEI